MIELTRDHISRVGFCQVTHLRDHLVGLDVGALQPDEGFADRVARKAQTDDAHGTLRTGRQPIGQCIVNLPAGTVPKGSILRDSGLIHPGRRRLLPRIAETIGACLERLMLEPECLQLSRGQVVAVDQQPRARGSKFASHLSRLLQSRTDSVGHS